MYCKRLFLAAGIAIAAASLHIVNALKAGTQVVGNGLKTASSARSLASSSDRLDRLSPFSMSMLGC